MSARQREIEFLNYTGHLEDTNECRKLVERIAALERDERRILRMTLMMAGLTAAAGVGLGYGVALQENFFYGHSWFAARVMCELGLAALISFLTFVGVWLACRRKLNGLLQDSHRLVAKLLESRPGELARESLAVSSGSQGIQPHARPASAKR